MRRIEYSKFAQVLKDPTDVEDAYWVVVIDRKTGIAYSGFAFQGEWLRSDVSTFLDVDPFAHFPAKRSV